MKKNQEKNFAIDKQIIKQTEQAFSFWGTFKLSKMSKYNLFPSIFAAERSECRTYLNISHLNTNHHNDLTKLIALNTSHRKLSTDIKYRQSLDANQNCGCVFELAFWRKQTKKQTNYGLLEFLQPLKRLSNQVNSFESQCLTNKLNTQGELTC